MNIKSPSWRGLKVLSAEIKARHNEENHLPDCGAPDCMMLAAFLELTKRILDKN